MRRVTRTSAIAEKIQIETPLTQGDLNPVGMVVYSVLSQAQFQALNGPSWVLADGRSIVGSTYAMITGQTNIPDLRGVFIRAKNNGRADGMQDPAGERAVGNTQGDAVQNITGTWNGGFRGGNVISANATAGVLSNNGIGTAELTGANGAAAVLSNISFDASRVARTATETRPSNAALNPFIKIA